MSSNTNNYDGASPKGNAQYKLVTCMKYLNKLMKVNVLVSMNCAKSFLYYTDLDMAYKSNHILSTYS